MPTTLTPEMIGYAFIGVVSCVGGVKVAIGYFRNKYRLGKGKVTAINIGGTRYAGYVKVQPRNPKEN